MPFVHHAARWLPFLAVAVTGAAWAASDAEIVPSTEAADIQAIVKNVERAVADPYALGTRPAMRDAHAKGHGCVKGEFTINAGVPPQLRHGVFARPHTFKAWIRFSNGAGTPHDDDSGDGRGMAIKLTGVPGEKLLAGERDAPTQDFVMINYPVFFIRNVADYVPFTTLSLQDRSTEFFATHPHEASVIQAITSRPVDNVLAQRYFSMSPYLLGATYIKFSAWPVDCASGATLVDSMRPQATTDPNHLRTGMIRWLAMKDACFAFAVQPRTDPATQPIEDPTIEWRETEAPFVAVASIRIPKQTFGSAAQQSFCENLSFTPWHALPAHRPVGGINRLRKAAYEATSILRHRLNGTARVEPTGDGTLN
jgi:Catalase